MKLEEFEAYRAMWGTSGENFLAHLDDLIGTPGVTADHLRLAAAYCVGELVPGVFDLPRQDAVQALKKIAVAPQANSELLKAVIGFSCGRFVKNMEVFNDRRFYFPIDESVDVFRQAVQSKAMNLDIFLYLFQSLCYATERSLHQVGWCEERRKGPNEKEIGFIHEFLGNPIVTNFALTKIATDTRVLPEIAAAVIQHLNADENVWMIFAHGLADRLMSARETQRADIEKQIKPLLDVLIDYPAPTGRPNPGITNALHHLLVCMIDNKLWDHQMRTDMVRSPHINADMLNAISDDILFVRTIHVHSQTTHIYRRASDEAVEMATTALLETAEKLGLPSFTVLGKTYPLGTNRGGTTVAPADNRATPVLV